jgi:outer membrane protein TolC
VSERWLRPALALAIVGGALPLVGQTDPSPDADRSRPAEPAAPPPVAFAEAVARAIERNPTVGQATQAILRARALLDEAKSVFRPTLYAGAGTTILDAARGFDGNVTQPRVQSAFNATLSYPLLAATRWAAKNQAADQVAIARVSAEETRRQVALTAAQSYLAVLAAQRQRDIALRNRDTARALADYSNARLEAGKGSRLNHVRSTQELATAEGVLQVAELAVRAAQEALGVAIFADGPVDASGDPPLWPVALPSDDAWLTQRPDVRLFTAQLSAADRVARDSWTSWFPTATASFTPRYVTPPGLFEPAKTWRALFQLEVPIYDGSLGATKRVRIAEREGARFRLDAVKLQARSELRLAQEAVTRNERIVAASREAAESAAEALRISDIAYKAGATSNIEVVEAQQTARNAELVAALAEDRLRQARLDLLVALGQFPQ